ncbi:MAG: hypothetical protein ACXAES_10830 [Promethearchaeota archaeon]|jgi:hypothetical protein
MEESQYWRWREDIYVEDNEIEIRTRVSFEDLQENEEILRRITNNLKLVVDIPFFFNGDPNKFQLKYNKTESEQIDIVDPLSLFHYEGINFNAYDETYDLSMIYALDSAQNPTKFVGFPLIANAYTDEGYKKIYQGVNISILFDIDESLEFHLKLTIL